MLKREPKERIGLAEIVSHPWMNRDGSQCCENLLCTSLVGREHVTPADHNDIIERMVEGGFPNKAEIQRYWPSYGCTEHACILCKGQCSSC